MCTPQQTAPIFSRAARANAHLWPGGPSPWPCSCSGCGRSVCACVVHTWNVFCEKRAHVFICRAAFLGNLQTRGEILEDLWSNVLMDFPEVGNSKQKVPEWAAPGKWERNGEHHVNLNFAFCSVLFSVSFLTKLTLCTCDVQMCVHLQQKSLANPNSFPRPCSRSERRSAPTSAPSCWVSHFLDVLC